MEMMPMLLIITMATYTLGKIAMTAVPMKENTKKREIRALLTILWSINAVHTYGESKCTQDVDNLNAQVKVVEIFLKNS